MYPISLDVRERRIVVIGGGSVAERKIRGLQEAQAATITIIAPRCTPELQADARRGKLLWHARAFEPSDLDGAELVFAATGDDELNARISALARERFILVNDASDASRGAFITPATYRVGSVTFAVETGGASPSLAARLREELHERYDERYARAAALLASMRDYAACIVDPESRTRALRDLASRPIDELALMNKAQAEHIIDESVQQALPAAEPPTLICATRASALAMTQTRLLTAKLAIAGIATTIVQISTKGDRVQDRPIEELGSDGVFIKELELALREKRADYAVHSCKDLPSTLPEDMCLAAITVREDPRDAFCSERYPSLEALPGGASVGTSSPRRLVQLRAIRPDVRFFPIRGNIDTRLRKLRDGEYDAIILAMAGLRRLSLHARHTVPLDADLIVPAAGQGALAVECRLEDASLAKTLHAALSDPFTEIAVHAERAFLRRLQVGCQAPVGAYAAYDGTTLALRGVIARQDGSGLVCGNESIRTETIETAELFGQELATRLQKDAACLP
jgi:hydroxymethylbilane synthase